MTEQERGPSNAIPGSGDDELSVEELEGVAGGGAAGDLPGDDTINTNCGGNCNCQG